MRLAYSFAITIPKNTLELNAAEILETLAISGKVTQLVIDIPDGWNFACGVQVQFGSHYYPHYTNNAQKFFGGNDIDLKLFPNLDIVEQKIKIIGFNNDTVNDHSCMITIEVEL